MQKNGSLSRIAAINGTLGVTVYVVFAVLALSGGHALAIDVTSPAVLSTFPANGAFGVAADLGVIVVTFSEPMKGTQATITARAGDLTPHSGPMTLLSCLSIAPTQPRRWRMAQSSKSI